MDIYISPRTAGRYGGGFKGDLRYFDQVIKEYLGAFKSSFDEFWLTLDYPPMYVLPGVVGIENDYKKYYETLPVFRLDRKNKKIEISLKAPEKAVSISPRISSAFFLASSKALLKASASCTDLSSTIC